jgi:hypothetical protein
MDRLQSGCSTEAPLEQRQAGGPEATVASQGANAFRGSGLNEELVIAGPRVNNGLGWGKVYEVPLHGIQGQDLVAYFPDLLVNGERINAGAVSFTHRKETRYGGC